MTAVPAISPDVLVPPHNYEAEMGLLGAVLSNNAAYDDVATFLRPEHFADPIHIRIYEAASMLIERGETANPITLKSYFEHDESLADVGGSTYLARLAAAVLITSNAGDLGRIVFSCWQRREGLNAAQELFERLHHDADMTEPDEILEGHMAVLDDLRAGKSSNPGTLVQVAVADRVASLLSDKDPDDFFKVGIDAIDDYTGGLFRGEPTILGGRPGAGKTGLMTTIAINMALAGTRVLFFSLEETLDGLSNRIIARFCTIPVDKLRRRKIDMLQKSLISTVEAQVADLPLSIDATPSHTIPAIRSLARSHKRKHGLDVVILDHLRFIRSANPRANEIERTNEASQGIKELCKELDVASLVGAQLNRGTESREDRRPTLRDLRQSGQIEEDARAVWFLYREHYYLAREKPQHKKGDSHAQHDAEVNDWLADCDKIKADAELIVAKINNGPIGTVNIHFDAESTGFR